MTLEFASQIREFVLENRVSKRDRWKSLKFVWNNATISLKKPSTFLREIRSIILYKFQLQILQFMRQIQGSLFWIPYFHAKPCFGRLKQPKFLKCLIWRGEGSRLPVRGLQGLEWGERGAVRSFTKWRQKCWLRRAAMSAPAKSFLSSWQRMTSIDTYTRGKDTTELLEVDQPTPRELNQVLTTRDHIVVFLFVFFITN